MQVICSGVAHPKCDPTCVHATSHKPHLRGCMCEDCNVTNEPEGGVGCINLDGCVEILIPVACLPIDTKEETIAMTTTANAGNVCEHLIVEDIEVAQPYCHMLNLQYRLQERVNCLPVGNYKERAAKIIFWAHCISDEFFELQEWFEQSNTKFSLKEVQMEFIDIWHFVMNVGLEIGISGEEIQEGLEGYSWTVAPAIDPFRLVQYSVITRKRIHSLLEPLPWKTWKSYNSYQFTPAIYIGVLKDYLELLKYLLLLAGDLGMTLQDVTNMYVSKNKENHARQDRGY